MGTTPNHPRRLADIGEAQKSQLRASIRVIATDVDRTLTTGGKIGSDVARAVAALAERGIEVLPVSGRPSGEIQGLVRYLPGVRRAIAENGLLLVIPDSAPRWLAGATDVQGLRRVGEWLNAERGGGLELAGDAYCRIGDVAYERDGRDEAELVRLREAAGERGIHLTWSNVHVHLAERVPDKGAAVVGLFAEEGVSGGSILTLGDAPNDEGLFIEGRFGLTVGTADVLEQLAHFEHAPSHVAAVAEGAAFVEVARLLLGAD
jgi:hydroxymethylpyrimidine pyrophosphatase-like HAD family hydrolase